MASYNRIVLVGNLTRDPQLSYTPNNLAICKFGIATNHRRKDKDGNTKEEVCFIDCTAFGRQAETFNQYMAKGKSVLVEGRLELQQWTSAEGEKKSKHAVIVENFVFMGSRPGEGGPPTGRGGANEGSGYSSNDAAKSGSYDTPQSMDEVPF